MKIQSTPLPLDACLPVGRGEGVDKTNLRPPLTLILSHREERRIFVEVLTSFSK
jgi:hypothetical protein